MIPALTMSMGSSKTATASTRLFAMAVNVIWRSAGSRAMNCFSSMLSAFAAKSVA
jgi:hypothetical protein